MGKIEVSPIEVVASRLPEFPEIRPIWRGLEVHNDAQYRDVGELLRQMAKMRKEVKRAFDPIVDAANKTHKTATKERKRHLGLVEEGIEALKLALVAYETKAAARDADSADGLAVVPAASVPTVEGVSRRSTWKAEVVDLDALIGFVASNLTEWGHLIKVNTRELDKLAAAHRAGISRTIPGVEAREVVSITATATD